jgi:hypothetical protein
VIVTAPDQLRQEPPHFDRATLEGDHGNRRTPLDRLADVVALDEIEAADLLFRLGDGPSVRRRSPSFMRTVAAVSTDCSGSPAM